MDDQLVKGNKQEVTAFGECYRHYEMATEDLRKRTVQFDKTDVLFRSHISKNNWPYRAVVFDPRVFTTIYEKTARILANKPRGRMEPRESGDAIGAKINNEILSFQWDDNERVDSTPMLAKWALMDLNARKYGASFGLVKWHYECHVIDKKRKVFFDGPNFKPWANRDVLHNPSYSTIKNWIQLRDYLTLNELTEVNDSAKSKPIYKNLDLLRDSIQKENKLKGGDMRSSNYVVKNLSIKGLTDYLGQDPTFKVVEVITEYRPDRWITFAPKHGVIIRDVPNPYSHGQIPVVQLKYYPVDDDIYGLSEIEPVEKLQNAINALLCQYLDGINMSLYAPLKIRNTNGAVQMHTLEFGPAKKWLMNDPTSDVITHDQNTSGIAEFTNTYRFLVSALQEALGETSASVSSQAPGSADKTATEIKDLAISRSARDGFNQIFLAEALKKQMMFWYKLNQQFLFTGKETQKIIRIGGKDAIKYFQTVGLDRNGLDEDAQEMLGDETLADSVTPQDLEKPLYSVDGEPKFSVEPGGQTGKLILVPEDLSGSYDYIPDIGSMSKNASDEAIKAKGDFLSRVTGVDPTTGQPTGIAAMMAQEGKKIKATDLLIDYAEDIGFTNADQYVENMPQPDPMQQMMEGGVDQNGQPINGGGDIAAQGFQGGMGDGGVPGFQGMVPAIPGSQAQPSFPGPIAI
jgi:hypothetical protein